MRILIIGGAEFLGSHLSERMFNEGNNTLCVDNFYTSNKKNVVHLIGNRYFELIRHDVTLPSNLVADKIYNLACPVSPVHYQFDQA